MWNSTAYPLENLEILIITPKKTYYTSKPNLTAEEKYKETMTLVYTDKNIQLVLGEQVSNEKAFKIIDNV